MKFLGVVVVTRSSRGGRGEVVEGVVVVVGSWCRDRSEVQRGGSSKGGV